MPIRSRRLGKSAWKLEDALAARSRRTIVEMIYTEAVADNGIAGIPFDSEDTLLISTKARHQADELGRGKENRPWKTAEEIRARRAEE